MAVLQVLNYFMIKFILVILSLYSLFILISGCNVGPKEKYIRFTAISYPQLPPKLPEIVGKAEPSFIVVTSKNWKDYYEKEPEGMNLNDNIYIFAYRKIFRTGGYEITVNSIID